MVKILCFGIPYFRFWTYCKICRTIESTPVRLASKANSKPPTQTCAGTHTKTGPLSDRETERGRQGHHTHTPNKRADDRQTRQTETETETETETGQRQRQRQRHRQTDRQQNQMSQPPRGRSAREPLKVPEAASWETEVMCSGRATRQE